MPKYIKDPKVTLLYPPNQSWPNGYCKPNGSLAYPGLGGKLKEMDIEVNVFDACVGNELDDLEEVFYKSIELPSGLLRIGVSEERILSEVKDSDIIGMTSIFSDQETMVLDTAKLIKQHYPEKLLITGGINARHRLEQFFNAGFDIICTSEAEKTIENIISAYQKGSDRYFNIPFTAIKDGERISISNEKGNIASNLDDLPMPAWELLPNERYWEIGRPHGGDFKDGKEMRYASLMTSLGCPFSCKFCHIAYETKQSISGDIGRHRVKSDERVLDELQYLKDVLRVKQVFIEDDSFLGDKERGIRLLRKIRGFDVEILNVNGINIRDLLENGKADQEVIELLADVGFREIVLPFESGNRRLIKKYATNKWDITNSDIRDLINVCKEYGLRIPGNFMIGFPDETKEEVLNTVNYARQCMEWGLDAANFFLVVPLPGTPIFDECIEGGLLPTDYNIDKMNWNNSNMINTPINPEELEEIRRSAWIEINDKDFITYKKEMDVR